MYLIFTKCTSVLQAMASVVTYQMGFWVPNRVWATATYLIPLRENIKEKRMEGTLTEMTDVVTRFKIFVETNRIYRMRMNLMFEQANEFTSKLSDDFASAVKPHHSDTKTTLKKYPSFGSKTCPIRCWIFSVAKTIS